jgi:Tat protein translocase TatB subunit
VLNVGTPELLVIMVVALLVLGPDKLPEVARKVGNVVGEMRRMSAGFQAEMRDALKEPLHLDPVEPDGPAPSDVDEPASKEPDGGDEQRDA